MSIGHFIAAGSLPPPVDEVALSPIPGSLCERELSAVRLTEGSK